MSFLKKSRCVSGMALLLLLFLVQGCGDESLTEPRVNLAPETQLQVSAPRAIAEGEFEVLFYWSGEDEDGEVVAYEYFLASPELRKGTIARGEAWIRTTQQELTLRLPSGTAETGFEGDPPGYAIWVRAIDDKAAPDPTPASSSFSASGLAPQVLIELPDDNYTDGCEPTPSRIGYSWSLTDDDQKGVQGLQSRYVLIPVEDIVVPGQPALGPGDCVGPTIYSDLDPVPWISLTRWSDWVDYDPEDEASHSVVFPPAEEGSSYLFAVQARDAAGNKSRTWPFGDAARNPMVSDTHGLKPVLTLFEPRLGVGVESIGLWGVRSVQVVGGLDLAFNWAADASAYLGEIDAYRYAWDPNDTTDPDDPAWTTWDATLVSAPPQVVSAGAHIFAVEVRDDSGGITRARVLVEALAPVPRDQQHDLLLVMDFGLGDTPTELEYENLWHSQWQEILGNVTGFDPAQDIVDGREVYGLSVILDYKAVIWFTNGASTDTDYAAITRIRRPMRTDNLLDYYQSVAGNLLLVGPGIMTGTADVDFALRLTMAIDFTEESGPPAGLGVFLRGDGLEIPLGMSAWAYRAWCVEAVDEVRPPGSARYGESPGAYDATSSLRCDYLFRAELGADFAGSFPSAAGQVGDLSTAFGDPRVPDANGTPLMPAFYKYAWEEFYDRDITDRPGFSITPRACQVPMFVHRAARDEVYPEGHPQAGDPLVANALEECVPDGYTKSGLDGASIGIVSSAYSATKPLPGSHDFLWGFHPLAFDITTVRAAIEWICEEDWGLDVAN